MKKTIAIAITLVFVLAMSSAALAASVAPVVYTNWTSGNAAAECAQIGTYAYAYKVDAAAPNGSWTHEGQTITISGSNGYTFDWSVSPNPLGAVIVKAGTGALVYFYSGAYSDTNLWAYENKEISHVTFCWNLKPYEGEWCSPGYWRQPQHMDSWAATGYSPTDLFFDVFGYYPTLSKLGVTNGATTNPTLIQVLEAPQYYGGGAFNAIGDLLSAAHPDVDFTGTRVEDSCPLN
jgi:hypothetical protein